jgi:hypothetical protein
VVALVAGTTASTSAPAGAAPSDASASSLSWSPPPLPVVPTLLHLDSAGEDDWVGRGRVLTFLPVDARFTLTTVRGEHQDEIRIRVEGYEDVDGRIRLAPGQDLAPGVHRGLRSQRQGGTMGFSWTVRPWGCGERGRSTLVVDQVRYVDGEIDLLHLSFEQRCGDDPPLRGSFRFDRSDHRAAASVPRPAPGHAWWHGDAPTGERWHATETFHGALPPERRIERMTRRPEVLTAYGDRTFVEVEIEDGRGRSWFAAPADEAPREGHYPGSERFAVGNPMRGGLTSHSCTPRRGWFVIDQLEVVDGQVRRLALRYGHDCRVSHLDGRTVAGEVRWDATVERGPYRTTFPDVRPGPHAAAIAALGGARISEGRADGRFVPDAPVTRGQMASFLVRALDLPPASGRSSFSDTEGSVHRRAIDALAAAGIASGYRDGTFRPGLPVSRAQMASFLARGYGHPRLDGPVFSDVRGGGAHDDAIGAIAFRGIAAGYGDGTFRPGGPVTRAQMASFLTRAGELLG